MSEYKTGCIVDSYSPLLAPTKNLISTASSQCETLYIIVTHNDKRYRGTILNHIFSADYCTQSVADYCSWFHLDNVQIHLLEGTFLSSNGIDIPEYFASIKDFLAEKQIEPDAFFLTEAYLEFQYKQHFSAKCIRVKYPYDFLEEEEVTVQLKLMCNYAEWIKENVEPKLLQRAFDAIMEYDNEESK